MQEAQVGEFLVHACAIHGEKSHVQHNTHTHTPPPS
jgi:hypothetical protein